MNQRSQNVSDVTFNCASFVTGDSQTGDTISYVVSANLKMANAIARGKSAFGTGPYYAQLKLVRCIVIYILLTISHVPLLHL